ncbi:hypothetical protein [Marinimicrobium sp. ABcell2]|uniref:hypothetical protein n=1 Tax=Marinimicrobium sp. ABcell2 TaxID=3069751 RepID=UPI0027B56CDA|nr:hypothetical protein [Marinimicrobium sp. ABcell2]MDQ2075943.1 hypothetical protein [Marinimicrobium sp. ABcell2]
MSSVKVLQAGNPYTRFEKIFLVRALSSTGLHVRRENWLDWLQILRKKGSANHVKAFR